MSVRRLVALLLVVVGVVCVVVGIIYFTHTSHTLPAFLPGHRAKGKHKHLKAATAALVVGVAALVAAALAARRPRTR